MSRDVEIKVQFCQGCQLSSKSKSTQKIPAEKIEIPSPDKPGVQYGIDITGPFYNDRYLVVLIDYFSKFPEVLDTRDISSSNIIRWLTEMWGRTGNPSAVVTDNGPQFISR